MLLKNGDLILEDRILQNTDLLVRNDKIADIGHLQSAVSEADEDLVIDCTGQYISPGYIDIHVHGGAGGRFESGASEIRQILDAHTKHGTTTMFPSLSTAAFEDTLNAIDNLADYMAQPQEFCNLAGIHLEGPYLNPDFKGAMRAEHIRRPIPIEYKRLLQNPALKRISYAPELDDNFEMTKYIADRGIIGAVAHSGAKIEVLREALTMGVSLITHLYSCMPVVYRENAFRVMGIPEAAYLIDEFNVEVIADAKHLPPDLLRLIFKIKGADSTILVTDGTRAAAIGEDAPNFEAVVKAANVIVKDGVAYTPDMQAFAGSITSSDRLVKNMVTLANASLPSAVKMVTATPARVMGIGARKGRLQKGMDADILTLNRNLDVNNVIVMGKRLYANGNPSQK